MKFAPRTLLVRPHGFFDAPWRGHFGAAALAVCSCLSTLGCGQGTEEVNASKDALLNSQVANNGDYPSAVVVWQNTRLCTATKVGPRLLLTAAHCVTSATDIIPDYLPGAPLHFTAESAVTSQPPVTANIVNTTLIPGWLPNPNALATWQPDAAVIEVDRDTPDIPSAVVDSSPLLADDPFIMLGYGYYDAEQTMYGQRHMGEAKAIVEAEPRFSPGQTLAQANYIVSPGPAVDSTRPGLGQGDSGGPCFRPNSNWVVGINVMDIGRAGFTTPALNFSTRVDSSSAGGVNAFLNGLGVNVGQSVPIAAPFGGIAHPIPGIIEAEQFDVGGQGLGYNDNDPTNNPDGNYRTEGVDLDKTTDTGGGYNVGGTNPNEWLAFTSQVADDFIYDLELRSSAEIAGQTVRVEVDGKDASGSITLPGTGAFQTFQTTKKGGIALTNGKKSIRVVFETGNVNLNWIRFSKHPCLTSAIGECGVSCATKCVGGVTCELALDCESGACSNGVCTQPAMGAGGQPSAGAGGQPSAGAGGQPSAGAGGLGMVSVAGQGGVGEAIHSAGSVAGAATGAFGGAAASGHDPLAGAPAASCSVGVALGNSRPCWALLTSALALTWLRRRRSASRAPREI